jgi:hypothetical protein
MAVCSEGVRFIFSSKAWIASEEGAGLIVYKAAAMSKRGEF